MKASRIVGVGGAIGIMLVALAVAAVFYFSDPAPSLPPVRPSAVPKSAIWAGGVDGGFWLDCATIRTQTPRLACSVYYDWTGELEAQGEYVPLEPDATEVGSWRNFLGFDGATIMLPGSGGFVPDGWLEFPRARKRQLFRRGSAVGDEQLMPP